MVGEDGFEPSKLKAADLQSVPFGHSGTLPYKVVTFALLHMALQRWSWWTDLNPRPADYKSAALPTELHQHFLSAYLIYHNKSIKSRKKLKFILKFLNELVVSKKQRLIISYAIILDINIKPAVLNHKSKKTLTAPSYGSAKNNVGYKMQGAVLY